MLEAKSLNMQPIKSRKMVQLYLNRNLEENVKEGSILGLTHSWYS